MMNVDGPLRDEEGLGSTAFDRSRNVDDALR